MGTREDLLTAAKQCLADRGYARTTVRDIVAASGSNLAAINYHFGTRDALLSQAMIESTTDAVQRILDALATRTEGAPAERLESFLRRLTTTFTDDRALWAANVESLAQALHSGEVRAEVAAKQRDARRSLARMLVPATDTADDALGAVLLTLLDGLLIQWLLDPAQAPTAEQIVAGLRGIATLVH
ncbi:TetR/AcrR family transcriptional regulator [Nocardia terpenica]|uniref:TetR/AcrR family transcriptional regulator n=1 Tax=Nocardia terpenica TaxID=455432 RepID=UPI0018943B70|nr:TetR/AcrR family transcriptional regulator [Nocardia terpenica]MBF6060084.1 TetR/AcrR family transcriptional regulator [Nocardia terpenica]MBF6103344.1 TetR/AcrR family transcriptional regulator [Nocardia terpenica]MBF6112282.1 TetR/AcrR family transcriptional regulator [Nocardia terpenica]MBF6117565.1 TetR/AcrR family transcriptional regulator [Nocardia terpenica]MBF6153691.1 TetR/AcrR family transcriptional regulator [Nocardia terpenica]